MNLMSKLNMEIWGREFDIRIVYDCYEGETILPSQIAAMEEFVSARDSIDASLEEVKNYCIKHNPDDIHDNISNIFKYVIPKYLYIPRVENKRIVAIMCNYRFDQDNGIAVVFENTKLCDIGVQDIIL